MKKREKQEEVKPSGNLYVTPLEEVLPAAMLPYAEFVILDRALPRVEDGLKPVQRRILYTMYEMGLMPDKPHKKSARIVGDCMGKYHPHGDSSVYDAMVRMAQDFNMGRTLVNGHGNFGSVDGDPAAAMRYTEARLEPLALELLRDLEKDTVSFSLNFDDSLREPDMLPGRFPNLLVNGASGIAVGLATNIPPHNLGEAIDGVVAFIDNPKITLEEMMKVLPAPDFPTGGYIIANELHEAYRGGKGRIVLRARIRVEKGEGDRKNIVIYELPYQVNKSTLLRKIAELREEKKEELAAITRVTDESDRVGMRAVIEVRGDTDIPALMKKLYRYTDLEVSFGMNMVAVAGGKPMLLGLLEIIRYYVNYQREVILRRSRFDLAQAKERCHILEGLIIAVQNIDEVIRIIRASASTAEARTALMQRFSLSERQAQAILDLRLARLTKLEIYKLEEELKALKALIEQLTAIVGSKKLQLDVVRKEILEIKKKYALPRRSVLVQTEKEAVIERADIREPGVASRLCVMADGTVKCITDKNFAASSKEFTEKTKDESVILAEAKILSDEDAFLFTNLGNCCRVNAGDCMAKLNEKGHALFDLVEEAADNERPVAVCPAGEEGGDLLFVMRSGQIKRSARSEYTALGKSFFQALKLAEGDEVLCVEEIRDASEATLFFVSEGGMCLNCKMDGIPAQGRIAGGVKGMALGEGDRVIFATQVERDEGEIVLAVSAGRFKRVIVGQVNAINRACKGVRIASLKEGERIIFADYVREPYVLAVRMQEGAAEISTEDVPIDATSGRGRAIRAVAGAPLAVYALKYKKTE